MRNLSGLLTLQVFILLMSCVNVVFAQERLPLQLLSLESLDAFDSPPANWQLAGHVKSDRKEHHHLQTEPGHGILVNEPTPDARQNLFTSWTHGDLELELEFMMPLGSNSGIYLQGRYEIQLLDSWGKPQATFGDVGGVYERWDESAGHGYEGRPPRLNASRAPGLWQTLKITFEAPVFDDSGHKIRHARFVRVELNGSIIQENVTVTGPTRAAAFSDESSVGPLMIQGDHGPVAFRNIQYKIYSSDRVFVEDVLYREYDERFDQWPEDLSVRAPARIGRADALSDHVIRSANPIVVAYEGHLIVPRNGMYRFGLTLNWITGDPHFRDQRIGGARLYIDNAMVLQHDQNDPYLHADVNLEAGTYPFTFAFFKSVGWRLPDVGLSVEGPDMPVQWLRALVLQSPSTPPVLVNVSNDPIILRGFVQHLDTKRTHTVSVGDPTRIHYSLDMSTGALLHAWRGPFVDAAPMWYNRGQDQLARPLGSLLTFTGTTFLFAEGGSTDSLHFAGYKLDADGRPVFMYRTGNLTIADAIRPDPQARHLIRTLTFRGQMEQSLWVRIASSPFIGRLGNHSYAVNDQSWYIEDAVNARIQSEESLLLPILFENGEAQVSYAIVW